MKLLSGKGINFKTPFRGHIATSDSKLLVGNMIRSSLLVLIVIFFSSLFLLPEYKEEFRQASSLFKLAIMLAGMSAVIFLSLISITRFIRSLTQYRLAHTLDQTGVVAQGLIVDKWIEEENGAPNHYVRYKYTVHLSARQKVDLETYKRLKRMDPAHILHLENQPHISRLEPDRRSSAPRTDLS